MRRVDGGGVDAVRHGQSAPAVGPLLEAAVQSAIREGLAGSAAVVVAPSGSCVRRPFRLDAIHHAGARASQGGDAKRARRPKDARGRVFRPPPRVGSAPSVAPAPESLRGSGSIDAVTMDGSDDDFGETRARKMSEAPASGVAPHTAPATFAS